MYIFLWCSDVLYTLKPSSRAVSLQHVPYYLILLLFSPPVHSIWASSLYTQQTIQMDARSPTQNYKRKKICPLKVQKETRNIEQFLINHLQLHAKVRQKSHCPAGLEWRALLAVDCVALGFWSVISTSAWATKYREERISSSMLGRKASPPWLVSPRKPSAATPKHI